MTRKLTAEQQAQIDARAAQRAADNARYGKHCRVGADMPSEFLNHDWDETARQTAFIWVAEAWGIEGGILCLPCDYQRMTPVVVEAYNRMLELLPSGVGGVDPRRHFTLEQQIECLVGAFHHAIWQCAGGRLPEFEAARTAAWQRRQTNE